MHNKSAPLECCCHLRHNETIARRCSADNKCGAENLDPVVATSCVNISIAIAHIVSIDGRGKLISITAAAAAAAAAAEADAFCAEIKNAYPNPPIEMLKNFKKLDEPIKNFHTTEEEMNDTLWRIVSIKFLSRSSLFFAHFFFNNLGTII